MQILEIVTVLDRVIKKLGSIAKVVVQPPQPVRAETLHDEPQLENIGPPRALEAANALIDDARRFAGVKQIRCLLRERSFKIPFLASQYHPGRQRQQHHLVWVPRQ